MASLPGRCLGGAWQRARQAAFQFEPMMPPDFASGPHQNPTGKQTDWCFFFKSGNRAPGNASRAMASQWASAGAPLRANALPGCPCVSYMLCSWLQCGSLAAGHAHVTLPAARQSHSSNSSTTGLFLQATLCPATAQSIIVSACAKGPASLASGTRDQQSCDGHRRRQVPGSQFTTIRACAHSYLALSTQVGVE